MRPGLAQEKEQEEIALLNRLPFVAGEGKVDLGVGDDDDRLLVLVESLDRRPQRNELRLQPIELLLIADVDERLTDDPSLVETENTTRRRKASLTQESGHAECLEENPKKALDKVTSL